MYTFPKKEKKSNIKLNVLKKLVFELDELMVFFSVPTLSVYQDHAI
jgi:hypothetical protein